MDWLLHDTCIQVYQRNIIAELSQFDKYIKEYKASLKLLMDDKSEVGPELIVITNTDSNSETQSCLKASNNRNTKLIGTTLEQNNTNRS